MVKKKIFTNMYKYKKKTIRPDAKKNPIILCPGSYRYEKYGVNLINFLNNNFQYKFQLRISKHSRNKIPEINKEKDSTSLLNATMKLVSGIFLLTKTQGWPS